MRYFLISYNWTNELLTRNGSGNVILSYSGFPPHEWIKAKIKIDDVDTAVIMNIFEFFNESDFNSFNSKTKITNENQKSE